MNILESEVPEDYFDIDKRNKLYIEDFAFTDIIVSYLMNNDPYPLSTSSPIPKKRRMLRDITNL